MKTSEAKRILAKWKAGPRYAEMQAIGVATGT